MGRQQCGEGGGSTVDWVHEGGERGHLSYFHNNDKLTFKNLQLSVYSKISKNVSPLTYPIGKRGDTILMRFKMLKYHLRSEVGWPYNLSSTSGHWNTGSSSSSNAEPDRIPQKQWSWTNQDLQSLQVWGGTRYWETVSIAWLQARDFEDTQNQIPGLVAPLTVSCLTSLSLNSFIWKWG